MQDIFPYLVSVIVLVLTFLLVVVSFQAFQVLFELRQALKRLNRILEEEAPSPKEQKVQTKLKSTYPKTSRVIHQFFRRTR